MPVVRTAQVTEPGNLAAFARYKRFTTYDSHFKKYSKRFFGVGFDWRYFKAQAVAESNLREDVRSPVGAIGVMQIMPRTFAEIQRKNPTIAGSVEQPRWNIAAGIQYDRQHFVGLLPAVPSRAEGRKGNVRRIQITLQTAKIVNES